ncbi:transposase [Streptomyces sp. NPDC057539]|uniref:IS701 family transposase n=1 Tax=Streptomyces sp. NPDC057539 TaxID=3346159 RepID=UPI0036816515
MEEIFRSFHRVEQRRWAQAYLWALIHVSGKKTPRRMALAEALPSAAAHGLHQFINASPWDWEPIRHRLARQVTARTTPLAWTVAELIIPKRGEHSVGVHQRMDAVTGRAVNCQRAMGLFLDTDTYCFPVDWSLVFGGAWDSDGERRRRARIPETETGHPAGSYVRGFAADVSARLQLSRTPWVLDLTRCDDADGVLAGLARQRLDVVCEVKPSRLVLPAENAADVTTVADLMESRHYRQTHVLIRRTADGRARSVLVHTHTGTVRLPRLGPGDEGGSRTYRVLQRPDPDGLQPPRYWITTLTDRRVDEVLRLTRSRAAALSTVTTLQKRFGLADFEGRSFPGWHHHMTMASAAYIYQHLYAAPGTGRTAPAATPPTSPAPPAPPTSPAPAASSGELAGTAS